MAATICHGMDTATKRSFLVFMLQLFLLHKACFSIGRDTLSVGQSLSVSDTLISQDNTFELGFHAPGTSMDIYLCIWYKNFNDKIIVWVANRERPVHDPASSRLELSADGNMFLRTNLTEIIWSPVFTSKMPNSTEAVLLDGGNFVIRDGSKPSTIYWQSFDFPTNTFLPGAKLGINKLTGQVRRLISWKNAEDPAPGMFSLGMDPNGSLQYFLEWNMSHRYWKSGLWDGERFSSVPEMRLNYIFNFSFVSNENESYFTYSIYNSSILSRLVLDYSGQIKQLSWLEGVWNWNLFWSQPRDHSDVYALCGAFGVVNKNLSNPCQCLEGFRPFALNDWSSGCVRKSSLQCQNKDVKNKKDWFLKMTNLTLPANSITYQAANGARCELDCMGNCDCTAYAYNSSGCSIWEGDLINLHQAKAGDSRAGTDIYIRLAASELQNQGGSKGKTEVKAITVILAVVIPISVITLGYIVYCLHKRRQILKGEEDASEDLLLFDFNTDPDSTNYESNSINNQKKSGKKNAELPLFSYESVSAATGKFSGANKLGEGGYGPVYKGKLPKGQEIAVKRLSKRSGQGLVEFRNESLLIAKLQHRNLVRLLGCCIERDENILIYEYMPNKSLDFFLFGDKTEREVLDWSSRVCIIEGIAQGLLYLHQHSRLRIIHRDLKPSNILLDGEMNPKISDFGMARIFGGNETQANTNRVVGTYGYMSPEYAMEGRFSIKSDVFSFGVLLLEIVSGKRNTGFYHSDSLNLLGYAWELWNSDRGLDLVDPILGHPPAAMLLKYINIGLLCVQESPADRPTMSDVVSMITNENAPIPTPKQPAFTLGRGMTDTSPSTGGTTGIPSVNNVTISVMEAR